MKNQRLQKGFGLVSTPVMQDPTLSLQQKAFYAYLATYASREDNSLYVSVDRMADECNVGRSTVKRLLKELVSLGIITRESRRGYNQSKLTVLLK